MKRKLLKTWLVLAVLLLGLNWVGALESEQDEADEFGARYREDGGYDVKSELWDWVDEERERTVPVKVYYPDGKDGPYPVILLSHGLGGSREGYQYLGKHWASHGYVVVHLQHVGSDDSVWKNAPAMRRGIAMKEAASYESSVNRHDDVHFVIDELERLNERDGLLGGKLDLGKIGMTGHSFGARTTMGIAGQVVATAGGDELSTVDDRVIAAVAMSPMPPKSVSQHDAAFARIVIPMMHLTGTLDRSGIDPDREAEERQIPFEKVRAGEQYLIVFDGGDHMIFSGRERRARDAATGSAELDAMFQEMIVMATVAFWDGYLRADEEALEWLKAGDRGLEGDLGETVSRFEIK
ncbi:MAG: hypothetical protein AAGD22_14100 [Verrucomicrobiota bacterium]